MSVIRVHKNKNFTVMSNTHLFDKNLSLKAAGLLSKILALPDNWNYSIKGLCAICKENETAVKNALNELRERRYVIVERIDPCKKTGGKIQYEYFVYEVPQGEENKKIDVKYAYKYKQEKELQVPEKQGVENLGVENLAVENMGDILNTNIQKTDILNTNKKADTSNKFDGKVNTAFLGKKSVCSQNKKTKSELQELQQDMIDRFINIGKQYNISEKALKNIINAFIRYLDRYTEYTGKIHPILKDETLDNIFVTLGTLTDKDFLRLAEHEPEENQISYLESMVDEHFNAKHEKDTDFHITHFANQDYLEKMALHIVEW